MLFYYCHADLANFFRRQAVSHDVGQGTYRASTAEHALWGSWTLPARAGGHLSRGRDPPLQDSAEAHRERSTIGRGATQMKKQKYLGIGLGLLLMGISGSRQAQAAPPAQAASG